MVFVYSSDSSGVFSLMSTITAPIEQSGSFGSSVAISGGFLAIGAHTAGNLLSI